jgi:hypothetical protein
LTNRLNLSGTSAEYGREKKFRQGSIFTQKPYLACVGCNTGWMKKCEDEMGKFARPIFSTFDAVTLNDKQMCVMAVWVALITTLAEYIDRSKSSLTIPVSDREYLKKFLKPPPHWSISAASLDGKRWAARYRHHTTFIGEFASLGHFYAAIQPGSLTRHSKTSYAAPAPAGSSSKSVRASSPHYAGRRRATERLHIACRKSRPASVRRQLGGALMALRRELAGASNLLFSLLLAMSLCGVFGMLRGMNDMAPRCMGMMCRFLVVSCLVMLCGFAVMTGCVSVVFGCLFVVVGGFLRHGVLPRAAQRL